MANTISYGEKNSGFQAGVIHGNVGNVTIVQFETMNQECLRDLRTTDPFDDKERIKITKGGLLKDSYRWILDNKEFRQWQDSQTNRLLWIRGDPGKGKTMLLCGIIEELTRLYGDNASLSFFFCQATDTRINSATSVLRGLIYLLIKKHPSLLHHVRARYDHAGKALFEDVNAWNALSTIFKDMLKDPTLQMTYLVIDALDECTNGLDSLLNLIVHESSVNLQIKWVVSSRNWPEITERLDTATQLVLISLELNESSVSEAVNQFIQRKVQELSNAKNYSDRTRDAVQRYLSSNSQGTFLWVALVCQNLRKIRINVLQKLESFPPGLDALYGRMFRQVRESEDAELCKEILAIMSTVFQPITLHELTTLIELRDDEDDGYALLKEIIAICGSFLILRDHTIVFVHQSAKEFLLKEELREILPGGIGAKHNMIFARSLNVMFKELRRDILNLKLPGLHMKDIYKPSPNPLAAAEYACVYWVDHLQESELHGAPNLSVYDKGRLDAFLQRKFFPWLEALSILGNVSDGIQAMQKLETLIERDKSESERLLNRARDASRFIRYHRTGIESGPLQVYCSPLILSPTKSLTRKSFEKERPEWVLNDPVVENVWSACLQTLEGHTDSILSVVWSPTGYRFASTSDDETIRVWDPATGQCVAILEGHSGPIVSIAWSPDGKRLASASDDETARLWDPVARQCVATLVGHSGPIASIAWSPDGKLLASASDDETARLWNPVGGQCVAILEGHSGPVVSIAWSPDGERLASASDDETARLWDPVGGQCVAILEGHSGPIVSIAWSPEGEKLASASADNSIGIWDTAAKQVSLFLQGHCDRISSISWSPDGSWLASAAWDKSLRIWNPFTGHCVSTLEEHRAQINSIAWSSDGRRLLSASDDKTVRVWDSVNLCSVSILKGHSHWVRSIAWSPDGSKLVSGSDDKTIRLWDPESAYSTPSHGGHSDQVTLIAWAKDGTRLASASVDCNIRIWDPATGQCLATLEGHRNQISSISWSPDRSVIASSSEKTVRIWSTVTGQCISILDGHDDQVTMISWSKDGSRIASGSSDRMMRIWDPMNGQRLSRLQLKTIKLKSVNSNELCTRFGTFDLSSTTSFTFSSQHLKPPEQIIYGLSEDNCWITHKGVNILWLPAEYRPHSPSLFAIHATTVAIGCSSGRVIFINLSKKGPIFG